MRHSITTVSLALAFLASSTDGVIAKPTRVGAVPVVRAAKKPATTTPAATNVGITTADVYPPPGATVNTALFPPESVLGYPGPTPSTSGAIFLFCASYFSEGGLELIECFSILLRNL